MKRWGVVLLALVLLTAGLTRLSRSAEGVVLLGDSKARADICRALPELAHWRQAWLLERLLLDPSTDVRCAAITACSQSRQPEQYTAQLLKLLKAPDEDQAVRSKSAAVLLARTPPLPQALSFLRAHADDPDFRLHFAEAIARLREIGLNDLDTTARHALLAEVLNPHDPAHEELVAMLRNHLDQFLDTRAILLNHLKGDCSEPGRQLCLAALTQIEGAYRGESAEDWERRQLADAKGDTLYPTEAEWATEIRPNYRIETFHGETCLALGEGAGGFMAWLKGMNGTVDVGRARLSLFAPHDGRYQPWARVYFSDKCGNSFGFRMNRRDYGGKAFKDYGSRLDEWHWIPLAKGGEDPEQYALKAGFHPVTLTAWEDSVYIDRFALIPVGKAPKDLKPSSAVRWDRNTIPGISFTAQYQAQPRGTTQTIVLWIRRASPQQKRGRVEVTLPDGFQGVGATASEVLFAPGNPLARTSIRLHLPPNASAGEGILKATYRDNTGAQIRGEMILGAQFDWLTTGPLKPNDSYRGLLDHVAESGKRKYSKQRWSALPL
ncbi:MAG: HEAT repeat domain-containing protein, partial [Planctomycetota bacterium]